MNETEKIKVLYIDGEEESSLHFKRSFGAAYHLLMAASTQEGQSILGENADVDIAIYNKQFPAEGGEFFFEEISKKHPHILSMVIAPQAAVSHEERRAPIYRRFSAPWQEADMRAALEEAATYIHTHNFQKGRALQKAYEDLDTFTYNVTHDLRGPVLSTLGAIALAKASDKIDDVKELLEMIEKSLKKMDMFIRNMHEYYNIKQGALQIKPLDFTLLIEEIKDLFSLESKLTQTRFDIHISQTGAFRSDELALKIIFNNLLSNAFKYQRSDNENKCVRIDIHADEKNAVIRVRDNGIGIEAADIDNIFKIFFRATKQSNGSGLGLYNVKDALRKLNGTIQVNSEPGNGTEFTVEIPSA